MLKLDAELLAAYQDHKDVIYIAYVEPLTGTPFTITEDSMLAGGCNILRSSGADSFPVGYVYCSQLTLNLHDDFPGIDFYQAKITINGSYTYDETTFNFSLGEYTITEPQRKGETLELVGYDDIYKTDKECTLLNALPLSATALFEGCCQACGINYYTALDPESGSAFPSGWTTSTVQITEASDGLTYRQVMGMVAALFGANVYISPFDGYVYVLPVTRSTTNEDVVDLTDPAKSALLSTVDITIGGVSVSTDSDVYTYGTGYLIGLTNNLIGGQEQACTDLIGAAVEDYTFRPFEVDSQSYPFADLMQNAQIIDSAGNTHVSPITHIDLALKGITVFKCSARTPTRNEMSYDSAYNKAAEALRLALEAQEMAEQADVSGYREEVARLGKLVSNSLGMYCTQATDSQGRTIYYFHDKSTLSASTKIWRYTINGFTISVDGGQTYTAGMDATGNVIVNMLSAIGVSADWVKAGTLMSSDGKNYWNLINGRFVTIDAISNTSIEMSRSKLNFFIGEPVDATDSQYPQKYLGEIGMLIPGDRVTVYDEDETTFIADDYYTGVYGKRIVLGIRVLDNNFPQLLAVMLIQERTYTDTDGDSTGICTYVAGAMEHQGQVIFRETDNVNNVLTSLYMRMAFRRVNYLRDIEGRYDRGGVAATDALYALHIDAPYIAIGDDLLKQRGEPTYSPSVARRRATANVSAITYKVTVDGSVFMTGLYCSGSCYITGTNTHYGRIDMYNPINFESSDYTKQQIYFSDRRSSIKQIGLIEFYDSTSQITGLGTLYVVTINQSSDARKKNVLPWQDGYDNILDEIDPVLFTWKEGETEKKHIGYLAQDVQEALENNGIIGSGIVNEDKDGFLGLSYSELSVLLANKVKKQQKTINDLEARVAKLEAMVQMLINKEL